jgi:hypothetical protein
MVGVPDAEKIGSSIESNVDIPQSREFDEISNVGSGIESNVDIPQSREFDENSNAGR